MFYLGVHIEGEGRGARIVVVEKDFYSGKKRYGVVHTETVRASGDALTATLLEMRLDPRWTAVKKVFSQSGRPPRIKHEPPLILLSSWDDGIHMAEALRTRCVSVEVVVREEPDAQLLSRLKARAFDNCHLAPPESMYRAMAKAMMRGSLQEEVLAAPEMSVFHPLGQALVLTPEMMPSFNGTTPWFYALGTCIWHGESIRRVKRY